MHEVRSIVELLSQVRRGEILLPEFQRACRGQTGLNLTVGVAALELRCGPQVRRNEASSAT